MDLKYLFSVISNIRHDHTNCTFADLAFVIERRKGLHREYIFKCNMCKKKETIHSEDPKRKC